MLKLPQVEKVRVIARQGAAGVFPTVSVWPKVLEANGGVRPNPIATLPRSFAETVVLAHVPAADAVALDHRQEIRHDRRAESLVDQRSGPAAHELHLFLLLWKRRSWRQLHARDPGAAIVNSGQGKQAQDFAYNSTDNPHPIVTVDDTLSSSAAQATAVVAQSTLTDLSGNVVATSPGVSFDPSGYTGQPVQFSNEFDAAGLADGTYSYTMTVTEQYDTKRTCCSPDPFLGGIHAINFTSPVPGFPLAAACHRLRQTVSAGSGLLVVRLPSCRQPRLPVGRRCRTT